MVQKAVKHLSTTMRHYTHKLVQVCQTLSDSNVDMISEPVVLWMVAAVCWDGTEMDESIIDHPSIIE